MYEVMELLKKRWMICFLFVFLLIGVGVYFPKADEGKMNPKSKMVESELMVNFDSKKIAHKKNANQIRPIASITKLMTMYLVYEALEKGELEQSEEIELPVINDVEAVSLRSISNGEKSKWPVEDLISATLIMSANDAAEALGHRLEESESFPQLMNQKARDLNLSKETHFTSASGLTTEKGESVSTASDLVLLATALIKKFPEVLEKTSLSNLTLTNGTTIYSTNELLNNKYDENMQVDGLKTGYTDNAGYCFVGTANKNGSRVLVVVLGAKNSEQRFITSENLLKKF